MKRKADTVQIVGFGETRNLAFRDDEGSPIERWGFNGLWRIEPVGAFHRWFELHQLSELKRYARYSGWRQHVVWLRGIRGLPVYMHKKHKDMPASREFPRKRIEAELPRGRYHCSTVDWLVAFAILEGFKRIEVYGVDFGPTEGGEPPSARACLEYWLGVAEGRGVETYVPSTSSLFKYFYWVRRECQYGYDKIPLHNVDTGG